MLHNTCMFCSVKFIFISKNLILHWRVVQLFQNMQWYYREPHEFTEILIINVDENSSVMHGNLDKLLLNATAVSDFKKKINGKSIIWERRSEPKPAKRYICHVAQSTLDKNSIINIYLPLMIFIRMHSHESQFHNKCLFCSIMSIIYVQIASFVRAFGKQIQTRVQLQSDEKFKKLYYRS